jgi:hypothetical protein
LLKNARLENLDKKNEFINMLTSNNQMNLDIHKLSYYYFANFPSDEITPLQSYS